MHALWPNQVLYTPVLAAENLTVPLMLLMFWLAASGRSLPAGLAFGLLVLVRGAGLFLAPGVLLAMAVRPGASVRARAAMLSCFVMGAGLAVGPWLWRNHAWGIGLCITTHSGLNLWLGNNPSTTDGGGTMQPVPFAELGEVQRDAALSRAARDFIIENPLRYARLCGVRLVRLLGSEPDNWAARWLRPTAANDHALVQQYREWMQQRVDDPAAAAGGREILRENLTLAGRWRRMIAPLLLAAAIVCVWNGRRWAPVVWPALGYGVALALINFQPRFRELWDVALLLPLAALLCDLVFRTRETGRRPAWAEKVALTAALVGLMLLARATSVEAWFSAVTPG
jgi:hypothetical protein